MILRVVFHIIAVLCLLLMIVCMVGWLRSCEHTYLFNRVFQNGTVAIGFADGSLDITDIDIGGVQKATGWQFHSNVGVNSAFNITFLTNLTKEEFSWAGFEYRVMPPDAPAAQGWIHVKHIYMFRMPIWSLIAILSLPQFFWMLWFRRYRRTRSRIKRGLCLKCGYDLRETTGKTCPECGAEKEFPPG